MEVRFCKDCGIEIWYHTKELYTKGGKIYTRRSCRFCMNEKRHPITDENWVSQTMKIAEKEKQYLRLIREMLGLGYDD